MGGHLGHDLVDDLFLVGGGAGEQALADEDLGFASVADHEAGQGGVEQAALGGEPQQLVVEGREGEGAARVDGHDARHPLGVFEGGVQGHRPALGHAHHGDAIQCVVVQERDDAASQGGVVGDPPPFTAVSLFGPVQGDDPVVAGQVGDEVAPTQGGAVHSAPAQQQHRRGVFGAFDDDAQAPFGHLDVFAVEGQGSTTGLVHEDSFRCRSRQRSSRAGSSVSRNP